MILKQALKNSFDLVVTPTSHEIAFLRICDLKMTSQNVYLMDCDDTGMRRMFRAKHNVDPRYTSGHLHKGCLRTPGWSNKFLEAEISSVQHVK